MQAYLGMVNYYSKFLPGLATKLSLIYKLLQKNCVFDWNAECKKAFLEVKKEISSDRNLVHFNPDLKLKLVCHASNVGIGAVLLHVFSNGAERPISFASITLSKAEKNYSVIHREALAICWAVQKYYQYLKGVGFILQSDHKPLLVLSIREFRKWQLEESKGGRYF